MLVKDEKGNELLKIIDVDENTAQATYSPITHALAVVKVGSEYLMGYNKWRKDWEIFGGCMKEGENLRECVVRECYEELGIKDVKFTFLGLMKFNLAPGYFKDEWREEYGGLYGITLPVEELKTIESNIIDKDEIKKLEFYSGIKADEKVSVIDKKLLEYWR